MSSENPIEAVEARRAREKRERYGAFCSPGRPVTGSGIAGPGDRSRLLSHHGVTGPMR